MAWSNSFCALKNNQSIDRTLFLIVMKKRKLLSTVIKVLTFGLVVKGLNSFFNSPKVQKEISEDAKKVVLCDNVLQNLTKGKWLLTTNNKTKIRKWDNILRSYRLEVGLPAVMWRKDYKCGFSKEQETAVRYISNTMDPITCESYSRPTVIGPFSSYGFTIAHKAKRTSIQSKINSFFSINPPTLSKSWPDVGGWCDANGKLPCCSDKHDGVCKKPSPPACACPDCVDTRMFLHPELSTWQVDDARCTWRSMNTREACDAIEKSVYDRIYFVGDSYIRNMYMAMLTLLSDDPVHSTWNRSMTEVAKRKCIPPQMLFWKVCRKLTRSTDDLLRSDALCGGRPRRFRLFLRPYYNEEFTEDFMNMVKSLLGEKGSLVLISLGYHLKCSSETVIQVFLEPALNEIRTYYAQFKNPPDETWPQLMFVIPMPLSILSPPEYFHLQNNKLIDELAVNMTLYCRRHSIRLIDFRLLAKSAHSFDGTHYGFAVNTMKNQIFLNFLLNET